MGSYPTWGTKNNERNLSIKAKDFLTLKYSSFEKKYGTTRLRIYEAAKNTETSIEASRILGIPYKTYVSIAKSMGVFKENKRLSNIEAPLEEILQGLHPNYSSTKLKSRLIEAGIKQWKCEIIDCGISTWLGEPITLELDHINGNNSDHRLENVRILCPNCHSQTPTYRSKKRPGE